MCYLSIVSSSCHVLGLLGSEGEGNTIRFNVNYITSNLGISDFVGSNES